MLTPHMGAHTLEAFTTMGRMAMEDLLAVLSGRRRGMRYGMSRPDAFADSREASVIAVVRAGSVEQP